LLGAALGHHGRDPLGGVGADQPDLLAARLAEGVQEAAQRGRVVAGGGRHQPPGVVVDHHRQVAVALLVRHLIDADALQPGQAVPVGLGVGDDAGDDTPDPFPGAYAELAVVPPIATRNLIPLPHDLPSDLATVADPFACALNGIEVLDVDLGDQVLILGAGPIGCWQAVMARDRGASRVYLSDVNRDRLEAALRAVGRFVDDAWVAGEDNGVAEVLSRTGGAGVARVSVAAPSKQAQQAALEVAAKRARVVYFAGLPKHDPVSPLDMNQLHYKELAILGAYGATPRQYRITMDYLGRRRDELAAVVTHRFPLDRIAEAFETIRSGAGLKMVIIP
jgi:L-iditol 2-dehydrogenase